MYIIIIVYFPLSGNSKRLKCCLFVANSRSLEDLSSVGISVEVRLGTEIGRESTDHLLANAISKGRGTIHRSNSTTPEEIYTTFAVPKES